MVRLGTDSTHPWGCKGMAAGCWHPPCPHHVPRCAPCPQYVPKASPYRAALREAVRSALEEVGPAALALHDGAGCTCGLAQGLTGQLHLPILTFGHVDGAQQRLDHVPAARRIAQPWGGVVGTWGIRGCRARPCDPAVLPYIAAPCCTQPSITSPITSHTPPLPPTAHVSPILTALPFMPPTLLTSPHPSVSSIPPLSNSSLHYYPMLDCSSSFLCYHPQTPSLHLYISTPPTTLLPLPNYSHCTITLHTPYYSLP